MAFDPSKYTVAKARPLPVILLLDRSGSMCGEKISNLNTAVNEMINSFKSVSGNEVEIDVGIISFGRTVDYVVPLKPACDIVSFSLQADGDTPMGCALKMAKGLLEDKSIIPSKGYRPAIVLVSDGAPNDDWQGPMNDFVSSGRSSKCERFALAIGTSEDDPVLNQFLNNPEKKVFLAKDASKIRDFFKFVTMSVSVRSKSQNPNLLIAAPQNDSLTDMARELGFDI